ncbi:hypothetical protein K438DRAFT_1935136 [Mycena galopus ATCC 62051]|nr:hypothetical protein K438DRAFT_1935136 [Mycena galopus ATCC 62051]
MRYSKGTRLSREVQSAKEDGMQAADDVRDSAYRLHVIIFIIIATSSTATPIIYFVVLPRSHQYKKHASPPPPSLSAPAQIQHHRHLRSWQRRILLAQQQDGVGHLSRDCVQGASVIAARRCRGRAVGADSPLTWLRLATYGGQLCLWVGMMSHGAMVEQCVQGLGSAAYIARGVDYVHKLLELLTFGHANLLLVRSGAGRHLPRASLWNTSARGIVYAVSSAFLNTPRFPTALTRKQRQRQAVKNSIYTDLIHAYPRNTELRYLLLEKEKQTFSSEKNLGLVTQAIDRARRWTLVKLTSTYMTLGLGDIARVVGIQSEVAKLGAALGDEARRLPQALAQRPMTATTTTLAHGCTCRVKQRGVGRAPEDVRVHEEGVEVNTFRELVRQFIAHSKASGPDTLVIHSISADVKDSEIDDMIKREDRLLTYASTFSSEMVRAEVHAVWAILLGRLADAVPDTHGLLIYSVWEKLPTLYRNQLSSNYTVWKEFCTAISGLNFGIKTQPAQLPVPWYRLAAVCHLYTKQLSDGTTAFKRPSECQLAVRLNRYMPETWRGINPDRRRGALPPPCDRAWEDPIPGRTDSRCNLFHALAPVASGTLALTGPDKKVKESKKAAKKRVELTTNSRLTSFFSNVPAATSGSKVQLQCSMAGVSSHLEKLGVKKLAKKPEDCTDKDIDHSLYLYPRYLFPSLDDFNIPEERVFNDLGLELMNIEYDPRSLILYLKACYLEIESLLHTSPQFFKNEDWEMIARIPAKERGFKVVIALTLKIHTIVWLSKDNLCYVYWLSNADMALARAARVPDVLLDYWKWYLIYAGKPSNARSWSIFSGRNSMAIWQAWCTMSSRLKRLVLRYNDELYEREAALGTTTTMRARYQKVSQVVHLSESQRLMFKPAVDLTVDEIALLKTCTNGIADIPVDFSSDPMEVSTDIDTMDVDFYVNPTLEKEEGSDGDGICGSVLSPTKTRLCESSRKGYHWTVLKPPKSTQTPNPAHSPADTLVFWEVADHIRQNRTLRTIKQSSRLYTVGPLDFCGHATAIKSGNGWVIVLCQWDPTLPASAQLKIKSSWDSLGTWRKGIRKLSKVEMKRELAFRSRVLKSLKASRPGKRKRNISELDFKRELALQKKQRRESARAKLLKAAAKAAKAKAKAMKLEKIGDRKGKGKATKLQVEMEDDAMEMEDDAMDVDTVLRKKCIECRGVKLDEKKVKKQETGNWEELGSLRDDSQGTEELRGGNWFQKFSISSGTQPIETDEQTSHQQDNNTFSLGFSDLFTLYLFSRLLPLLFHPFGMTTTVGLTFQCEASMRGVSEVQARVAEKLRKRPTLFSACSVLSSPTTVPLKQPKTDVLNASKILVLKPTWFPRLPSTAPATQGPDEPKNPQAPAARVHGRRYPSTSLLQMSSRQANGSFLICPSALATAHHQDDTLPASERCRKLNLIDADGGWSGHTAQRRAVFIILYGASLSPCASWWGQSTRGLLLVDRIFAHAQWVLVVVPGTFIWSSSYIPNNIITVYKSIQTENEQTKSGMR